ncbi:hypothetical protein R6Q57_023662 [Mikania cordata]
MPRTLPSVCLPFSIVHQCTCQKDLCRIIHVQALEGHTGDSLSGYKEKIVDIREEILRKRRAGKLPGDTTSVLKSWWQSHAKWPYPTEEDKARLVQETGLQLKQINNWFINQRKRNWHSNPSSSTVLKSKRKR